MTLSELSDEDMNHSEDDENNDEPEKVELSKDEKAERMRNLVAPLDQGDWGQKRDVVESEGKSSEKEGAKDDRLTMRPSMFSKVEYDGVVSDSESEEDEADLPPPDALGRKIAQMRWADTQPKIEDLSDEDAEEVRQQEKRKKKLGLGDDIDDAMMRKVVDDDGEDGDGDVDMDGEAEEFLQFARKELGYR